MEAPCWASQPWWWDPPFWLLSPAPSSFPGGIGVARRVTNISVRESVLGSVQNAAWLCNSPDSYGRTVWTGLPSRLWQLEHPQRRARAARRLNLRRQHVEVRDP